jgi:ribonuclease HI
MTEDRPHVALFTDGACSGNPGPGGWAFILKDLSTGDERECADGDPQTTNNRMELVSVIRGLESLDAPSRVELYSDSQYVIKGLSEWLDGWIAKGWKRGRNKPVLNRELWERLDDLRNVHDLMCHWIRGHNDHAENERCDRMAVEAAERYRGG